MDDATAVGVVQRGRHVPPDLHRLFHRELLFPDQEVAKGLAFHERHDEVEERMAAIGPVGPARVVQGEDVGVLEPRGNLDLTQEPLGAE